jgi:hypothetical protein
MAFKLEDKEYTTVGRGEAKKYMAKIITEDSFTVSDPAELLADLLSLADQNLTNAVKIVEQGANQHLRFKDAPGADPMEKLLAFAKKNGISNEDLLARLTVTQ